jgi:hypothetical protein
MFFILFFEKVGRAGGRFFYFLFPVRSLATTKVVVLTLDAPEVTI